MKILLLNAILYTPADKDGKPVILPTTSIAHTMIVQTGMEFARQGHQVTLVAASDYAPKISEQLPIEIVFLRSAYPRLFPPAFLPFQPQLWNFLRMHARDYDLIISSEVFAFPSLMAGILSPERTLIWQELGQHNRKFFRLPSKFWYHIVARMLMRKVSVVPRSPLAGRFIRSFGLNVADVFIDHGVNNQIFFPQQEKENYFLVVSQLCKRKNILSILIKYKAFVNRYPTYKYPLYIAGEGEEREMLETYVRKNELQSLVMFLGYLSAYELSECLRKASCILCNPLKDLNMIAIGEAIASGTPVIMNTVPYSHEWVRQYKLGIVKPDWTEEDMMDIIKNNAKYVKHCLEYAPQISLSQLPKRMIDIFFKKKRL